MKYLLGIDVGTTGTKSLLFRQDGLLVAQAYRGYPTMTPSVGRSEQDPRDWWRAVTETVRQLCADEEISKNVAAISLSLQGGTVVSVDAAMEPLRPAMVWSDVRCASQRQAFAAELGSQGHSYISPADNNDLHKSPPYQLPFAVYPSTI